MVNYQGKRKSTDTKVKMTQILELLDKLSDKNFTVNTMLHLTL